MKLKFPYLKSIAAICSATLMIAGSSAYTFADEQTDTVSDVAALTKTQESGADPIEIDAVVLFKEDGTKAIVDKKELAKDESAVNIDESAIEEGGNEIGVSYEDKEYTVTVHPIRNPDAQLTPAQVQIIDIALNGGIYESQPNMCAAWVSKVFQAAGQTYAKGSGPDWWASWGGELQTSKDVPAGAVVIGTGKYSNLGDPNYYLGHVGICIGDQNGDGVSEIIDCTNAGPGGITMWNSVDEWASWQIDPRCGGTDHEPGYVGWVWLNGIDLR